MDDRTLLEMAARAYGWRSHRYCEAWKGMASYTMQDGYFGPTWNPLTDDGDALRLAVKLRLDVQFETGSVSITNVVVHDEDGFEEDCAYMLADDATGAARRAVVRAAAAIGAALAGKEKIDG